MDISIHTLYSVLSWSTLQPRFFLGMTWQALLTWIWGFSAFYSADTLKMLGYSHFSGLFRNVYFGSCRALAGPLKDIQRVVPKPVLCCLAVCLGSLSCWKVSTLDKVFIKSISVHCSIQLFFNKFLSPCHWKKTHSMMLPPPCSRCLVSSRHDA